MGRRTVLVCLVATFVACGGAGEGPSATPVFAGSYSSAHVIFQYTTLESLSTFDNGRVYEVGYSIAEFVVSRWGRRALRDLVTANGDTTAVLHLGPADFHREWFAFVRERYGL